MMLSYGARYALRLYTTNPDDLATLDITVLESSLQLRLRVNSFWSPILTVPYQINEDGIPTLDAGGAPTAQEIAEEVAKIMREHEG
jgi:hypothetical protein